MEMQLIMQPINIRIFKHYQRTTSPWPRLYTRFTWRFLSNKYINKM